MFFQFSNMGRVMSLMYVIAKDVLVGIIFSSGHGVKDFVELDYRCTPSRKKFTNGFVFSFLLWKFHLGNDATLAKEDLFFFAGKNCPFKFYFGRTCGMICEHNQSCVCLLPGGFRAGGREGLSFCHASKFHFGAAYVFYQPLPPATGA